VTQAREALRLKPGEPLDGGYLSVFMQILLASLIREEREEARALQIGSSQWMSVLETVRSEVAGEIRSWETLHPELEAMTPYSREILDLARIRSISYSSAPETLVLPDRIPGEWTDRILEGRMILLTLTESLVPFTNEIYPLIVDATVEAGGTATRAPIAITVRRTGGEPSQPAGWVTLYDPDRDLFLSQGR
jgi:hypothetical protein